MNDDKCCVCGCLASARVEMPRALGPGTFLAPVCSCCKRAADEVAAARRAADKVRGATVVVLIESDEDWPSLVGFRGDVN